jgi:uncharacterized SAM-binding protein YcdF (DUF218 family)/glycosyltransferase involved in cell wall biosynthesis
VSATRPPLGGETIVCISSIDWDFNWQGHQEIMSALATWGNRVLFVENTGVRPPTWRDLPRLRSRIRNWHRGVMGFREERPNLFLYSPLVLPLPYSRVARWINRLVVRRAITRWLRAVGASRPLVWTFLPTPLALALIRDLDPELTVYYCIDDLPSSSTAARRIRRSEDVLFRTADLVFVTADKLRERAARCRPDVHVFPFAVSFTKFAAARDAPGSPPADVTALPRPVVGYLGGLNRLIDQELLVKVAAELPEASFVFVGPLQEEMPILRTAKNARLLGPRPHDDVPYYLKAFDVALVPYRVMEYTENIYPTKLNEYLAMGLPVVSTDLHEVRRFNDEHGTVVRIASEPPAFARAIREALADRTQEAAARRIAIARQNSWEARIAAMSGLIGEALARRRGTPRRWEGPLRALYAAARRRTLATVAGLAATYVVLFHTPLPWLLAAPLAVIDPPRPADAVVVFAGGVGESGQAGGGYQERVRQAVELYRAGFAPLLVFSSGYVFAFPEAEVMRDLAQSQGIPAAAIILEPRARNTRENILFVGDLLRARGIRSALLVTSPYHTRRALLSWHRLLPDVTVTSTPVPVSRFYAHHPWSGASLEQLKGLLHEYAAIVAYWWRGWL